MTANDVIEIGRVKRSHGLHGELKVQIKDLFLQLFPQLEVIIIEQGEEFLPFFVEYSELKSTDPIVKFESVQNKEEATKLNGLYLYALKDQVPDSLQEVPETLIGFQLLDQTGTQVGEIIEVLELPSQTMLTVSDTEFEYMIPYHPDLIMSKNASKQELQIEIPDGLLDIFRTN